MITGAVGLSEVFSLRRKMFVDTYIYRRPYPNTLLGFWHNAIYSLNKLERHLSLQLL